MSRELTHLLQLLRPHAWRYALGGLFLAGSDLGQLAVNHQLGAVIDGLRSGHLSAAGLLGQVGWLAGFALAIALSRFAWRMNVFGAARRVEREVRRRLYEHLQTQSASYFLEAKVGDLMAHATNDVQAIRGIAGEGFMCGWDAVVMTAFTLILMAGIHRGLMLASIAPLVVLPVLAYANGKALHRAYAGVQAAYSVVSGRAQEAIAGIRVVKGFAREREFAASFASANQAYRRRFAHLAWFDRAFDPLINVLTGLGFTIALAYGGSLVAAGQLSLGHFIEFNGDLLLMSWPMLALGWTMNWIQRGLASMGRLQALFDLVPAVRDAEGALGLPAPVGHVRVQGLSFRYGPDLPLALDAVDLELAPGRTVGILGSTGSGKSTLANLLVRVFNPPRGSVSFDGIDVADLKLEALRQAIAYVPQDAFLFSRSIRDNIGFEPTAHPDGAIEGAARAAQVDADVRDFAAGYDTMLGERGITLSGGQRQRVGIARALLKDAQVLVLDDCLSAVDTATEAALLAALRPIMATRATLLISHRVSALQHADEILVLDAGQVRERGTHASLLSRQGEYARLHAKQQIEAAIEELA